MIDLFPAKPDKENVVEVANSLSTHAGVYLQALLYVDLYIGLALFTWSSRCSVKSLWRIAGDGMT